jgi:mono/diheme cytochrome c family protein
MRSLKLLAVLVLMGASTAAAQSPTFGLGRTPDAEEVRAWDISISPTGEELPEGSGTAIDGALVYRRSCARCHGGEGVDGDAPRLVKSARGNADNPWSYGRVLPIRAPYATTVWDYINRAMPLNREGSLSSDQVYAITALLLYWNDLVEEDEVMDRVSLPLVEMPNVDTWAPLPDWQPNSARWPGYPY